MDTELIAHKARSMEDLEGLLSLLNEVKAECAIGGEKPFTIGQLKALCYFGDSDKRYTEFAIKKKSGGERTICAPVPLLKAVQRCLNVVVGSLFTPHFAAYGFVKRRSVVGNASLHTGWRYVYNIDLQDFFPSISYYNVKGCLEWLLKAYDCYGATTDDYERKSRLAGQIATLCCKAYTMADGRTRLALPQGAPTSPMLSNMVFRRIDAQMNVLACRHGMKYSRYADDMTFSSDSDKPFAAGSEFLDSVNDILRSHHFRINDKKTRLQSSMVRQEVTGLVVNEKANVTRQYVREIRTLLYVWRQHGHAEATRLFRGNHKQKAAGEGLPTLERFMEGKLLYMKMVKGTLDTTYLAMKANLTGLMMKLVSETRPLTYLKLRMTRASLHPMGVCQIKLVRHAGGMIEEEKVWTVRPYDDMFWDVLSCEYGDLAEQASVDNPMMKDVWPEIRVEIAGRIVVSDRETYRTLTRMMSADSSLQEVEFIPVCDEELVKSATCSIEEFYCNIKPGHLLPYNNTPNMEERQFMRWLRKKEQLRPLFDMYTFTTSCQHVAECTPDGILYIDRQDVVEELVWSEMCRLDGTKDCLRNLWAYIRLGDFCMEVGDCRDALLAYEHVFDVLPWDSKGEKGQLLQKAVNGMCSATDGPDDYAFELGGSAMEKYWEWRVRYDRETQANTLRKILNHEEVDDDDLEDLWDMLLVRFVNELEDTD